MYTVFTRTWWKRNSSWPNGLEPCLGHKNILETALTREQARELCKQWNEEHNPGILSRKAEFERG